MSDLVERKLRADLDEATKQHMPAMVVTTDYLRATLDRITALETALEEAEGRVIADVVAWCLREMYEPFTPLERTKALKSIATALETGEWKK